ncbi:restriction endonuclease subunit S [Alistipes indistinctus]|nr:restriction endonuclease subunit S [Alistipes indistinctus]
MRFPEFTGEWKEHSLSEYLEFKNGLNPDAKRIGKGIPFLSVMDILADGVINYDNIRGKVEATEKEIESFGVNSGDLLFQRSSETLEDVGRANVYMDNRTAVYGGFVIRGRKIGSYDPFFVKYLLATPLARKRTCRMGAGAQHFNIGQESLAKISLYFPSMEEQQKIAEFLSLLDERIATQNKIIEDLKKLKSAISVQLFNREILLGSHHNWEVMNLSDITVNFNRRNKDSIQYPMYSVTNVSGFSPQNEVFDGKEIKNEDISIYKIIHKGEFAYNPARINVGSIGRYDGEEPCMISSLYICFRPIDNINSDWLLHYLKSDKMIYKYGLYGEGGVRIYLFYPNFSRIKVLVPPFAIQKRIASIITTFNKKIRYEELLIKGYQAQKKYLQSKMFI